MGEYYNSKIKTDNEFKETLDNLCKLLSKKGSNIDPAEDALLKRLTKVKNIVDNNVKIENKKGFENMLIFFEYLGGRELMDSNIGNESTDVLFYFVDNYNTI